MGVGLISCTHPQPKNLVKVENNKFEVIKDDSGNVFLREYVRVDGKVQFIYVPYYLKPSLYDSNTRKVSGLCR